MKKNSILLLFLFIVFSCQDPETGSEEQSQTPAQQSSSVDSSSTSGKVNNPFSSTYFDVTNGGVHFATLHVDADGNVTAEFASYPGHTISGSGKVGSDGHLDNIVFDVKGIKTNLKGALDLLGNSNFEVYENGTRKASIVAKKTTAPSTSLTSAHTASGTSSPASQPHSAPVPIVSAIGACDVNNLSDTTGAAGSTTGTYSANPFAGAYTITVKDNADYNGLLSISAVGVSTYVSGKQYENVLTGVGRLKSDSGDLSCTTFDLKGAIIKLNAVLHLNSKEHLSFNLSIKGTDGTITILPAIIVKS